MKVKITFILVFLSLFLGFRVVSADVIINEVKYSPTTKQWIEIYNDTNEDIDITTYKILDSGATTNGHNIIAFDDGSNIIPKHGFGVISKSPTDFGTVSFPLFKSALNIKVSEDTIILKNDSGEIDSIDIDGSAIGGNSFQKISGSWVSATPTPGLTNEDVSADASIDTDEDTDTATTATQEQKEKVIKSSTMKAKILASTLAFAGQPLEIKTNILGYSNENVVLGKAYWNFGDGGSSEQINNFEKFYHTYYYPGEYVLILEYYSSIFSKVPDATSKMTIRVLPTTVTISKIGDVKDFFIELTNNATSEIDVSGWIIRANNKVFVLPRNTVIMAKKQMMLSSKITGFVYGDQYILKLFSATGELIFDYNNKIVPIVNNNSSSKTIRAKEVAPVSTNSNLETETNEPSLDLAAAPILTGIDEDKNSNFRNSYFFFGFVLLLIIAGGAVYYLRQNKNNLKEGEDFEILDE